MFFTFHNAFHIYSIIIPEFHLLTDANGRHVGMQTVREMKQNKSGISFSKTLSANKIWSISAFLFKYGKQTPCIRRQAFPFIYLQNKASLRICNTNMVNVK
jgi:hypothetical protein